MINYGTQEHRRTGRGGSCPPPIRAVCRHEFGQSVDIIRAKHNTCLNNMNLGSVTAVNGKKPRIEGLLLELSEKILAPHIIWIPGNFCYYPPPPTEYGSRKMSATTPPPLNPFGQNSVCPPKWMSARTPMRKNIKSLTLIRVHKRNTQMMIIIHIHSVMKYFKI